MPTIGYSHRPVALGRRGMVASAHSYAPVAGLDVLRSGGTAAGDSLRFPRIPDGLAAEPDDPREPRGAQGSGLAADLRAERPEPGVRRSPDPVGSGPHLDRSGRRGPRPLLPRPRRPGDRSAD